jgi:hypothetical protein
MKSRYTYRLLMQSEEKSRNILETAVYGLVAISVITSIWQFAEQPNALPLQQIGRTIEQPVVGQFPS